MVDTSDVSVDLKAQLLFIAFGVVWQVVAIYHVMLARFLTNNDINSVENQLEEFGELSDEIGCQLLIKSVGFFIIFSKVLLVERLL